MAGLTREEEDRSATRAPDPGAPDDLSLPEPYEAPELYDRVFETLDFDLEFWKRVAREGIGPVLDVGCGTGRVMLPLLADGVDVDGIDLYEPMLERLRVKAADLGKRPRLVRADMREFTMPRRYARAICTFNAFAHCATTEDQLRTLRCIREHLEPGGALVLFMSYPRASLWLAPDGVPDLEITVPAGDGRTLEVWDHRTKYPVEQRQVSRVEIREVEHGGRVAATHWFRTTQRWIYPYELDLLLRLAGFERREIRGGFHDEPLERDDQPMLAWAWTSAS